MSDDKNNIIYTAKDIAQYLDGKLAPAQMHAMEKAALDDPFLADAMEGFEVMKGKEWNGQLAALYEEFAAGKKVGAKVISLSRSTGKWWKAAAAILVIGSGTAMTWLLTRNNEKESDKGQQIAQVIVSGKDSAASNTTTGTLSSTESKTTAKADTKLIINPATGKTSSAITPTDATVRADSGFVYKPGIQKQLDVAKTEKVVTADEELEKNKTNQTTVNSAPPVLSQTNTLNTNGAGIKTAESVQANTVFEDLARKKIAPNSTALNKTVPLNRRFIAQVVGPDNAPLPYANINIRNENFGTYADVKGNFRLVSTDSLLNVEVKSVGYLTRTYTLRSSQAQNKIVLAEDDIAVKERMISKDNDIADKKSFSRRATLLKDSVVNVEPADGWDNYSTYVANNINIPEDILKKEEHGEVEITFDVKSNGTITNIKVDQSNCDHCAVAAKRVIEQGPQWKVKKGKKASARVKLQF